MNRINFSRAILLAGYAAAGCAARPKANLLQARPGEFHYVAIGLCEDYPEESRSLTAARRDLELIHSNHLDALWIAFDWDAIEPEPGKFDSNFWDEFVRMADENGVRLIPYVYYTPRWAASEQGENFWRQPPKDNAAFANFMKQIVTRYKGRIHSWEIWNEPDNRSYWLGSPEQFADLLQDAAQGVREAHLSAEIVMGKVLLLLAFKSAPTFKENMVKAFPLVNGAAQIRLFDRVIVFRTGTSPITLTAPLRPELRRFLVRKKGAVPVEEPEEHEPVAVDEPEKLEPHEILGVSSSVSVAEIKSAYRTRIKECHPDQFAEMDEHSRRLAEEWTKALNAAYETLLAQEGRRKV